MAVVAEKTRVHEKNEVHEEMILIGQKARDALEVMATSSAESKNLALARAAELIRKNQKEIMAANERDMQQAKEQGASPAMLDRLALSPVRIESIAKSLEEVASFPDPVGKMIADWRRPNGLRITRVSVPLGVIGVIYESRPNVTADAAGLCIKSGNAVILRGGSESFLSSNIIVSLIRKALAEAGLPEDAVQLVPTRDREAVSEMLKMNDYIDVIIPRGGKSLTEKVRNESLIPTLQQMDGNCHTYIHEKADAEMAKTVILNAKMRRTGICGATESLVIDEAALSLLPAIAEALLEAGCEIRGDAAARKACPGIGEASAEDWGREYLDAIISVKTVSGIDEAISHINTNSSGHTEAIITSDKKAADIFLRRINSAIVIHNASTQFADGGEFGMGAEIGISTGRLHARGPVGLEQLTTYKYVVYGDGQTRPK